MRRIYVVAAMLVAALSLSAVAFASTSAYKGAFSPSGKLSFKLTKSNGTVRLSSLAFIKFPLSCNGGANTETAAFKPSFKPAQPDYPKLRVVAVFTKPGNPKKVLSTLVLKGRVHTGGGSVSGTMRIHGSKVPTDNPGNGSADRCDSGKVHWSASRQ